MNELKIITTDNSGVPAYLDFNTLRKRGIDHIAAFSGKIWTDHNLHDPGITILEALCYVLTDLDYRTRLDFKDLIARRKSENAPEDNFLTPARILGNNPLTVTDYRKLLIDIKGVRNAWLEKMEGPEYTLSFDCNAGRLSNTPVKEGSCPVKLNGLYKVYLEPDDVYAAAYEKDACGKDNFPLQDMLDQVNVRLHGHRNLCEDFADVIVLREEPVSLCLHLELAADVDQEDLLVKVFGKIQDFFSPTPRFYTLQQLLEKGRTMEEIFEGRPYNFDSDQPLQQHGFIDTKELEEMPRHKVIHASDLYRIIMDVPGVAGITRLVMFSHAGGDNSTALNKEGEEWCLELQPHHRPVLAPEYSNVIFFRNRLPFTVDLAKVKARYIRNISDYSKSPKKKEELDTVVPEGRELDLAQYHSVQYEFPLVYNIGKNVVPEDAMASRKAQSLQLQAYLLFYDRLLADYFAQLANIRSLFALSGNDAASGRTYFPANIDTIPQLPSLLRYTQQLPEGNNGAVYKGMKLAWEPAEEDRAAHRQYSSSYLRDEAIQRLAAACDNNELRGEVEPDEDGFFHFSLQNSNGDVLLTGYEFFETEKDAAQAARDVLFLAGLPDSYSRINNREEELYSFDLVYNDTGYTEMITALYETDTQYLARKDRFMNHLLARFSEDFTDYVIMMYGLRGKQNDPAANIRDKAGFLSVYPDLSANRGRAFNYQAVTEGFPVCGLQKRAGRLLGINQTSSLSLNNFDIITADAKYIFRCYLPGQATAGTPLFVSRSAYNTEEEAKAAYHQFLLLAADKKNYRKYGCAGEGVYGFYIQSPSCDDLWIDAHHPVEYITACKRDDLITWMTAFFEGDGRYTQLLLLHEGFYFLLRDDEGKLLFRSLQGYETDALAFTACCECLEALQSADAYRVIYREDAANYMIEVTDTDEHPPLPLARHPQVFNDEAAAQKAMEQLIGYFKKKNLVYKEESTDVYGWELYYAEQPSWKSTFSFKEQLQLGPAFTQFLELAAEEANYRVLQQREDQYGFELTRKDDPGSTDVTIMATHPAIYGTVPEAEQAIQDFVALFTALGKTLDSTVVETTASVYYFYDPETPADQHVPVLTTLHAIAEGPERAAYIRSILQYAADPARLEVNTSSVTDTSCFYVVQLSDAAGVVLAESPLQEEYTAATRVLERIVLLSQQQLLLYEKGTPFTGYRFLWKGDDDTPPLQGTDVWENAAAARNAAVNALIGSDSNTLGGFVLKQQEITHYYFSIRDDDKNVLLEQDGYYDNLYDVRTAFYKAVQLGKSGHNYLRTDTDHCTYGFSLQDEREQLLAIHPQEYQTVKERDEALFRVISYLQDHGVVTDIIRLPGSWRYVWQWLSCCGLYPESALEGLEEKTEEQDAKDELQKVLLLATEEEYYEMAQSSEGYQLFIKDENAARLAVHPRLYACEKKALLAMKRLMEWAAYTLSGEMNIKPVSLFDTPYHKNIIPGKNNGFRLWKRDYRIAAYYRVFRCPDERNDAVGALRQCYILEPPVCFMEEPAHTDITVKNKRYGAVYQRSEGVYAFHLYNPALKLYEWESTQTYTTAADAFKALYLFLQLLRYTGNYCLDDQDASCSYTISLGRVLLDIKGPQQREDCPEIQEDEWEQLHSFLSGITGKDDEIFFPYTDHPDRCHYGFRMIDSNGYRVARHTVWYHSPEKRERARLDLLAHINCKRKLYSWLIQPEIDDQQGANTDARLLACYFPQPELLICEKLWKSLDRMPVMADWQAVQREEDHLWYYRLVEKGKDGNDPCDIIWQSVNYYNDKESAEKAEGNNYYYVYLLELARAAVAYWYEPVPGKDDRFILSLKDMDGTVVAVVPHTICRTDKEKDQATRMMNAMLFPVVESEEGYTFEINNVWQKTEQVTGAVSYNYRTIWEGIRIYTSPDEALTAVKRAAVLLQDLENYQRVEDGACGPFGIELTDPAAVLATHPQTYSSITARDAAIEEVKAAISAEGFHLVEHILLRPREQELLFDVLHIDLELYAAPEDSEEEAVVLSIVSRTFFDSEPETAAFAAALRDAVDNDKVYIDDQDNRYIVSFWNKDIMIASATLRKNNLFPEKTQFCEDVMNLLKEQLVKTTGEQVIIRPLSAEDVLSDALLALCPGEGCCSEGAMTDPYSFWATVVVPGWPRRFQTPKFRRFMEDTLRKEAPSHIRLRIIWVSPEDMYLFEAAWKRWLAASYRSDSCDYRESLSGLVNSLMSMRNIYPVARLYDETGGGDDPLIVLDETMVG